MKTDLPTFLTASGGGTSRERILSIMKDSHIGSYGVIGLILYFALLYTLLSSLPLTLAGSAILAGDPFSKGVAGMIINRLPYARKEEEAKNKTVYSRMTTSEYTCCLFSALIPMFWLPEPVYLLAGLLPVLVFYFLTSLMKKKIQGYTGDCCGATFLLCELSFYLGIAVIYTNNHIKHILHGNLSGQTYIRRHSRRLCIRTNRCSPSSFIRR